MGCRVFRCRGGAGMVFNVQWYSECSARCRNDIRSFGMVLFCSKWTPPPPPEFVPGLDVGREDLLEVHSSNSSPRKVRVRTASWGPLVLVAGLLHALLQLGRSLVACAFFGGGYMVRVCVGVSA